MNLKGIISRGILRSIMPVTLLAVVFVSLGMFSTVLPYFTKPEGRGYNWMEGFTDDYIGYVSYVKEGMYGNNFFSVRSLPKPQPATTAQLILIYTGKIGKLAGLTAPVTYHAARAISGLVMYAVMYLVFRELMKNRVKALTVTFMASVSAAIGWYSLQNGSWAYRTLATFGFTENVALRFASRPHYLLGAALFLGIYLTHIRFRVQKKPWHAPATLILSLVLGTMHPSFAVLLAGISAIMLIYTISVKREILNPYLTSVFGLGLGILLSYWSTHQYPYTWILSFEEYVYHERLGWPTILGDIISFGPMLWLGVPGLIYRVIIHRGRKECDIFMLVWILMQIGFFFLLYRYLRTERVRYIQSLYFIPMAYGTFRLLEGISLRLSRYLLPVGVTVICILCIPTVTNGFVTSLTRHTDYRTYSYFVFPTREMLSAYRWLNDNTPKESTVTAAYEALNNILLYSHNYVVGNKQGWPYWDGMAMEREKDDFLSGRMTETQARSYLARTNIEYVYKGYQEPDGFTGYDFVTPVFRNSEVVIYRVNL